MMKGIKCILYCCFGSFLIFFFYQLSLFAAFMKNEGTRNMYIDLSKQEEKLPDEIQKPNVLTTSSPTSPSHLRKPTEKIVTSDIKIDRNENTHFQSIYKNIQNRNRSNVKYLMVLFTTLYVTPKKLKTQIQINTLINMKSLEPEIKTLLFTNETIWIQRAKELGIDTSSNFTTNRFGTPTIKSFYFYAYEHYSAFFYCYQNGDILLPQSIKPTLQHIQRLIMNNELTERVFIFSRRYNYKTKTKDVITPDNIEETFERMKKKAKIFIPLAVDIFIITPYTWNWNIFPPLVIGRPFYDGFLLDYSYHHEEIATIEITNTVYVIHQNDRSGDFAWIRLKHKDSHYNLDMVNDSLCHPFTLYTRYVTNFDDSNQVYLSRYYNASVAEYPLLYNCTIKGNYSCVTSIINNDKYYGNIINENHETLIHYAINYNHFNILRYLLNRGCNIYVSGSHGVTPLHYAAMQNNPEMLSLLLSYNSPINNVTNIDKDTALHISVRNNCKECVKVLLDSNPDLTLRNNKNKTPFDLCKNEEICKLITQHQSKI